MKSFELGMSRAKQIVDKDVLNLFRPEYFNFETLDTGRVALHHLSNFVDLHGISIYSSKLKNQHHVLATQIIILILQRWNMYEKHLNIIREVQKNLTDTVEVCKDCRNTLNLTSSELIFSSLKILYYFRKRKVIGRMLKSLHNIRKVYRVMERLQQLLFDKNYPKLVSSILELQKATETQKQYFCMIVLHQNLSEILEQVETNLDMSLSTISINFDIHIYASIFTTYKLLGKSQAAIDQLHIHFIAAVHNSSLACILKYVKTGIGKQFSTVCKSIPSSSFIPCLLELCMSLLNILKSYCLLVKWHEEQDNLLTFNEANHKLSVMNQQYVSQILENGIIKICSDIKAKVKTYLDSFNLKSLKIEDFLHALCIIEGMSKNELLIQNKEEDELYKYSKRKFLEFLHFYHGSQLDELKTYLENDGWELCPIKSALNFHEFSADHSSGYKLKTTLLHVECNPYIDSHADYFSYFSNASLDSTSYKSKSCQFEVKSHFGAVYSTNLKRTISHIKDNLISEEAYGNNKYLINYKIKQPQLSPTVDLTNASTLFGLKERIVAAESLIFFGLQLESVRNHFNSLMLDDCTQHWLDKFYCQTVSSAVDMRKPIYTAAVSKILQLSDLLPFINYVNYEQNDLACQHSSYIDFLLKEIFQLKLKLRDIQQRVPFNADTMITLWDCVAYVSAHLLVDAFSTIKKCSNGGRALMQLDFTQFIIKYESITSLKPMPYQNYVASYIKAYYLPEMNVEAWIKEHPEYTSKHLMGLISCMPMNKKLKQKLSTMVEGTHRQE